jgi:hypothetical protein
MSRVTSRMSDVIEQGSLPFVEVAGRGHAKGAGPLRARQSRQQSAVAVAGSGAWRGADCAKARGVRGRKPRPTQKGRSRRCAARANIDAQTRMEIER